MDIIGLLPTFVISFVCVFSVTVLYMGRLIIIMNSIRSQDLRQVYGRRMVMA